MADEIQTDAEFQDKNKRFKDNMGTLFEYQLAIENYEDLSGDKTKYSSDAAAFECLYSIREHRKNNTWNIDKLLDESEKALILFDKLTDEIGKEHFDFSDDGYIEYKYDYEKIQKEKENGG